MTREENSKTCSESNVMQETIANDKDNDYVTKCIGNFGTYQFIFIFIASISRSSTAWNSTSIVFIAPETKYVCTKFSDNATLDVKNNTCYDNCIQYEYMNDIFEESIISEFGLICQDTWLRSLVQTVLMLGVLCGVSLFGWVSDGFGRSRAIILSGIISATSMCAIYFSPNLLSVLVARFFAGIGTGGYFALTPVYMSELTGSRVVEMLLLCLLPLDGTGLIIEVAFAYLTTTWRSFMIVSCCVTVCIVCLTFFLPETPRWLIAKGKRTKAIKLLTRAALMNKRDTSEISKNVTKAIQQLNLKKKNNVNLTYFDLFKTKKLTIWSIASFLMWFVAGFSYFGLLQHVSNFGSKLYVIMSILGVIHIVPVPISLFMMKYCKRKVAATCVFSLIGILTLALVFTPKGSTAAVVSGSFGVAMATSSFSVVYIIVIELYPTTIRNMGLSFSSIGSKAGAMIAPFVVNIKTPWIASSIFSAIAFSAVITCFLLPETKGTKLKDTIEDLES